MLSPCHSNVPVTVVDKVNGSFNLAESLHSTSFLTDIFADLSLSLFFTTTIIVSCDLKLPLAFCISTNSQPSGTLISST